MLADRVIGRGVLRVDQRWLAVDDMQLVAAAMGLFLMGQTHNKNGKPTLQWVDLVMELERRGFVFDAVHLSFVHWRDFWMLFDSGAWKDEPF